MSTIPRFPPTAQESEHVRAVRLAAQLTPIQRQVLVQAGLPTWLALPTPGALVLAACVRSRVP
jgi:hypothetical protein